MDDVARFPGVRELLTRISHLASTNVTTAMVYMDARVIDDRFELRVLFEMDRSYRRVLVNGTVPCPPDRVGSAKGRNGWNAGLLPL